MNCEMYVLVKICCFWDWSIKMNNKIFLKIFLVNICFEDYMIMFEFNNIFRI